MGHAELLIQRILDRRLKITEAAQQLGLGRRQMSRIVDAYKAQGAQGLISKKRGKRSNRAYAEAFKQSVLSIRLVELRFCTSETTFDYMYSTPQYLARHGKPVAFYSDKHSVFRVNQKDHAGGVRLTQFGRALADLNIDIIYASRSQAKGRVERMNKTLQDRLVKELRLQGINTMEDGNELFAYFP